jgi:preprotein translocase subunit SecF
MEFIKPGTHFDFVKASPYAYAISGTFILISVLSLILHGGPKWGVDFTGGLLVQVKFNQSTPIQKIRDGLVGADMQDSVIQAFGAAGGNEFLIRSEKTDLKLEGLAERVKSSLAKSFPASSFEVRRVETVGPKVGRDLRDSALYAIFFALLLMMIYISGRFEFKWVPSLAVAGCSLLAVYLTTLLGAPLTYMVILTFLATLGVCFIFRLKYALGAIIALIHDVMVTVGVFSLLNLDITLGIVAALLTIVGYSVNDTIIVFDRIRENLRKFRRQPLPDTINASVNETLSRTILTSGTVMLVVVILFFLGGPVIRDFALAMIVGVVTGTWSSIYVASPILLIWPPEGPENRPARTEVNIRNRRAARRR